MDRRAWRATVHGVTKDSDAAEGLTLLSPVRSLTRLQALRPQEGSGTRQPLVSSCWSPRVRQYHAPVSHAGPHTFHNSFFFFCFVSHLLFIYLFFYKSFLKILLLVYGTVCGLDVQLKSNFLIQKLGISLKFHWDCMQNVNLHLPIYKFAHLSAAPK